MKNLFLILLIAGLFLSCEDGTEIEYVYIDDNEIVPTDFIVGKWVKDGMIFDFKDDHTFRYYDEITGIDNNSGEYRLLDGKIHLDDIANSVYIIYYFSFVENYPWAGSVSLRLVHFDHPEVILYFERI